MPLEPLMENARVGTPGLSAPAPLRSLPPVVVPKAIGVASPPPPKWLRSSNTESPAKVARNWRQVLSESGLPADIVLLDFEAYFDPEYHMGRDQKALSTIEYVQDKRFEILGCGFLRVPRGTNFPNHEGDSIFHIGEDAVQSYLGWLQDEYGNNLERCTVVAQNAVFDCTVLSRRFGIDCPHIIDILGLARHWHSRSNNDLAALCKRHGLKDKGDTSQFSGVTMRTRWMKPKGRGPKMPVQRPLATEEQLKALAGYGRNDVMREWELFEILLPKLSNPATELRLMQQTLELYLKPQATTNQATADELIAKMKEEMDVAVNLTGVDAKSLSGDKSFSGLLDTALERAGDNPQRFYKMGKRGYLLAIAQTDPERELLVNHSDESVRNLMAGRISLESWPKHIQRIERLIRTAKAIGGLLPIPLKYCGAHTGRWSGDEKLNPQNFGSKGHPLATKVREVIKAIDGHTLVIVDASQIEARVTGWIAGQEDLLEDFRTTDANPKAVTDVYTKFASKVLGYEIRKPAKSGVIPAIELRMGWARNSIGKIGVLGCGYGMGPDKAEAYAEGKITNEQAKTLVKTYRETNKQIVKFWYDIEDAFIYTAKYKKPCQLPRGLGFSSCPDCDVIITLPNGRELKYHQVKLESGQRRDTIEVFNDQVKHWEYTWGGSLCENVVQAMSRDILAEMMLRMEDHGYRPVLHSHDEWVGMVPTAKGDDILALGILEMRKTPTWAPGLPLNAEGKLSKCYTK